MAYVPSKDSLKNELASILAADLGARERAHRLAREAATHEEAKPENDKDTRALEQSYLARGEALRVEELRAALAEVKAMTVRPFDEDEPVALGALVETDELGAAAALVWLVPHGGGCRLARGSVQVVTPRSPFGRALLGKRAADECEVSAAGKTRTVTIARIT